MDDDLQRLARALRASPYDVEAARRYDASLRRAGRGLEADRRLLDKYICPRIWDHLQPINSTVRLCDRCEVEVPACGKWEGRPKILERIEAGLPFAFPAERVFLLETLRGLVAAENLHTAREPHPGRAHLDLQNGTIFASDVEREAKNLAHLLEEAKVWILPLSLGHWRRPKPEQLERAALEALSAFLEVARRVVPKGREPLVVFELVGAGPRGLPTTLPPRHVLGWIIGGEGGAMFCDRAGKPASATEADIGELLDERRRAFGSLIDWEPEPGAWRS